MFFFSIFWAVSRLYLRHPHTSRWPLTLLGWSTRTLAGTHWSAALTYCCLWYVQLKKRDAPDGYICKWDVHGWGQRIEVSLGLLKSPCCLVDWCRYPVLGLCASANQRKCQVPVAGTLHNYSFDKIEHLYYLEDTYLRHLKRSCPTSWASPVVRKCMLYLVYSRWSVFVLLNDTEMVRSWLRQ